MSISDGINLGVGFAIGKFVADLFGLLLTKLLERDK